MQTSVCTSMAVKTDAMLYFTVWLHLEPQNGKARSTNIASAGRGVNVLSSCPKHFLTVTFTLVPYDNLPPAFLVHTYTFLIPPVRFHFHPSIIRSCFLSSAHFTSLLTNAYIFHQLSMLTPISAFLHLPYHLSQYFHRSITLSSFLSSAHFTSLPTNAYSPPILSISFPC